MGDYVAGLDLSLTATGIALVSADSYQCSVIKSTGRRGDSIKQRRERIGDLVWRIAERVDGAVLAVVEGPSVMSKGGSNWDRAWLWGAVVEKLFRFGIPVAIAAPTVVKKWAAGKGTADKAAVAVGVARLWPDFECGSDNEADAVALATMGAQHLGWDMPSRAHHADARAKVEWPMEERA